MGVVPMPWQGTEIRPRLLRDLPPTPFVSDSPDDHDALRVLIGRPTVLFSASWYERWDTLLYGTRSGLEKKDNQLAVVPARSKGRESHSIGLPCPGRALMNIQMERVGFSDVGCASHLGSKDVHAHRRGLGTAQIRRTGGRSTTLSWAAVSTPDIRTIVTGSSLPPGCCRCHPPPRHHHSHDDAAPGTRLGL